MNREKPQLPNRDEEFYQLAEQLATPTDLFLASQEYEKAREVFFNRLENYVLRSTHDQVNHADEVVSSIDYKMIMTNVTIDMINAFAADSKNDKDLIESITDYFVNESQGLVGDMNAIAGTKITGIEQTADDFRREYIKTELDDDNDNVRSDIRLANTIVDLHGESINKFVTKLILPKDDQ